MLDAAFPLVPICVAATGCDGDGPLPDTKPLPAGIYVLTFDDIAAAPDGGLGLYPVDLPKTGDLLLRHADGAPAAYLSLPVGTVACSMRWAGAAVELTCAPPPCDFN